MTITQRFVRHARDHGLRVRERHEWGSDPDPRHHNLPADVAFDRNNPPANVYQWRRANRPHHLLPLHPVDTLWQHITVTFDTGPLVGDFNADMRTVERIGFERFGAGFSYNLAVDMDSGMVGIGQPFDAKGTHTIMEVPREGFSFDQNFVSLGAAFLGMPGKVPSANAVLAMGLVIQSLIEIDALRPGFDYKPHRWANPGKTCPTDPVVAAMPRIHRIGKQVKGAQ